MRQPRPQHAFLKFRKMPDLYGMCFPFWRWECSCGAVGRYLDLPKQEVRKRFKAHQQREWAK